MPMTRDNHYVPQFYLKHFASEHGLIQRYRFLVSRDCIPLWKEVHIAGVAYQQHLYTRVTASGETDEIENWLNREFETPAATSIEKVIHNQRLEKADYRLLARFLASQIVRTPAFLVRHLPRWNEESEPQLQDMMERIPQILEASKAARELPRQSRVPHSAYIPMKVVREPDPEGRMVRLKVQSVLGRGHWFFTMKHLLTSTWERLVEHKWTILAPPEGLPWFTTDDPVICLNFHDERTFDFGGGWASPGTEIMLPLSPRHLLYTQIGRRTPQRGTILPRGQAATIRTMFAQHAFRYIFSPTVDASIEALRPCIVNAAAVRNDIDQWRKWHYNQSQAEREMLETKDKGAGTYPD